MSGGCRLVYDMDKILEWGKKILPSPAVLFFAHIVSISNCLFAVIWLFWLMCQNWNMWFHNLDWVQFFIF